MAELILIFLIITSAINLAVLILVAVIYFKVAKGKIDKSLLDRRYKGKIAAKVEKEAAEKLSKVLDAYSLALSNQTKENFQTMTDLAVKSGKDLADFIKKQEEAIVKESQYLVATNVVKMEKEMENYRQNQIKKLDSKINTVLVEVSKQVLGKAVDLKNHQELIIEALNKAKAENLFSDES